ncbi:MoaD/ThiS family protein [Algoriphagus sediminis]|uniref:MoaD/ThiS family protein n=1 Tax=Algoriphagus sediminis TaxID=3057113 RepID=A0ABT7YFE8_9BACT|nr:MoaD/ThiS family protein [Algoriphagus sediminis]MDN3205247.1 hypothetical protein [Algoriphagus sediminis]
MKIEFRYHGKLSEVLGRNSEKLQVNSQNAGDLIRELILQKPQLKETTFQLAQKNKILKSEAPIEELDIDVFPPFSGG